MAVDLVKTAGEPMETHGAQLSAVPELFDISAYVDDFTNEDRLGNSHTLQDLAGIR